MFEELFNSICCCSCGLCCSKDVLCEKCVIDTLKGNGLKLELANQIQGLRKENRNVSSSYSFSMSELGYKLKELRRDPNNFQIADYDI